MENLTKESVALTRLTVAPCTEAFVSTSCSLPWIVKFWAVETIDNKRKNNPNKHFLTIKSICAGAKRPLKTCRH
jgi:hypothetical protein